MDRNISPTTKAAEGFLQGIRWSLAHSLVISPFIAYERVLETGKSFAFHWLKQTSFACVVYCALFSATFGLRHYVYKHKDRLVFDM